MVSKEYAMSELGLTKEEYKKLKKWHKKVTGPSDDPFRFGAIGGEITFHITPTSLGSIIEAECFGKTKTLRGLD